MRVGMACSLNLSITQRLCLMKKCPHCGGNNDLSTVDLSLNIIPLCLVCDKPLWKYMGAYVNFATGRIEAV